MKVVFIPLTTLQEQTKHFPDILSLHPRSPRPHAVIWFSVRTFLCNPQKPSHPHATQLHGSTLSVSLILNRFAGFSHFSSLQDWFSFHFFLSHFLSPHTYAPLFTANWPFSKPTILLWGFHVDELHALSVTYHYSSACIAKIISTSHAWPFFLFWWEGQKNIKGQ